jgi:hypothetical protein
MSHKEGVSLLSTGRQTPDQISELPFQHFCFILTNGCFGGEREPRTFEGKQTVMAETPVCIWKSPATIVLAILTLLIRDEWNLSPETARTHRNNKGKHCH